MINLSQLARENGTYSLMEKIQLLFDYDIYLAENIRDYKKSAYYIKTPWYKTTDTSLSVFGVIIRNVGIDLVEEDLNKKLRRFIVHDATDRDLMLWYGKNGEFGVYKTFEQVQKEQGLRQKDWVYQVNIKHISMSHENTPFNRYYRSLAIIEDVKKHNYTRIISEKESLLDRLKGFLPQINIQPQEI